MTTYTLLILSIPAFVLLWRLIGKAPNYIARILEHMRENATNSFPQELSQMLHVFSAETTSGTEAEFINEYLPENSKIVRFLRIVLIAIYLAGTTYAILNL